MNPREDPLQFQQAHVPPALMASCLRWMKWSWVQVQCSPLCHWVCLWTLKESLQLGVSAHTHQVLQYHNGRHRFLLLLLKQASLPHLLTTQAATVTQSWVSSVAISTQAWTLLAWCIHGKALTYKQGIEVCFPPGTWQNSWLKQLPKFPQCWLSQHIQQTRMDLSPPPYPYSPRCVNAHTLGSHPQLLIASHFRLWLSIFDVLMIFFFL